MVCMEAPVVFVLQPRGADPNVVGFIPQWLCETDPRPARVQLDQGYKHGGGWQPFEGHKLEADYSLSYPGDPPMMPLAMMLLHDERVLVYDYGWVAIVQPDRTYEVCRMD